MLVFVVQEIPVGLVEFLRPIFDHLYGQVV